MARFCKRELLLSDLILTESDQFAYQLGHDRMVLVDGTDVFEIDFGVEKRSQLDARE